MADVSKPAVIHAADEGGWQQQVAAGTWQQELPDGLNMHKMSRAEMAEMMRGGGHCSVPDLNLTSQHNPHEQAVVERERRIEQAYPGARFQLPGVDVPDATSGGGFGGSSQADGGSQQTAASQGIHSRLPMQRELDAVEAALKHSDPAYRESDGNPLVIAFADRDPSDNSVGAIYSKAGSDHPCFSDVTVYPNVTKLPATHNDLRGGASAISSTMSLEAAIDHELGHATEDRTGGLSPVVDAQYKREAGWRPLHDPADGRWALEGKDGFLYEPIKGADEQGNPMDKWVRLEGGLGYDKDGNYQGHYVDIDGKQLSTPAQSKDGNEVPDEAAYVDVLSMMQTAKVPPVGAYFPSPGEEMAEALRAYRVSEHSRHEFFKVNPQLYRAAQHLDQRDIDQTFGAGKKVRLPDGTLGDATEQNKEQIQKFEQQ